ncbi:MAG: extracellular solute-binding protein [Spirochaetota bacterium]|nr:extracellular solute-binding protein [Spirochaetota bacterium]
MNNIYRFILPVLFLSLVSCGEKQESLRIFMWTDNIPVDVYKDFETETGIKIIEDAISSNEEIYAKVKTSGGGYDIVTPSLDYATIMMQEGLLAILDTNQMPNLTNIDPNIMKHILAIDSNHQYIMPFAFGPTVIAYDTTLVTNDITGFDIFSNSAYTGRMLLLNDMREVMGAALIYLGYGIDETNAIAMQEVTSLLMTWKQNILRFDSDSFQLAYANGEVDIVQGYSDTIIPNLTEEKKNNTKFIIPLKGGMMWLDSFLVLKDAPNKEAAVKFINYIHRPEVYARIMDHIESLSINVPARKLITTEARINYEDLSRSTMLTAISSEAMAIQARVWENIQAQ